MLPATNLVYITQDNLQVFMRNIFLNEKLSRKNSHSIHAWINECAHTEGLKIKKQI